MKQKNAINFILFMGMLAVFPFKTYSQKTDSTKTIKMKTIQEDKHEGNAAQILIDKFIVPKDAKQEFMERMNINRNFIKQLPGFVQDAVYESNDEHGNEIYVTVAVWQNEAVFKKAREAVQAEYKKQNFDLPGMLKRLNITIDRGVYKKVGD